MSTRKEKFSERLHQLETMYQNIQEHSGHEIDDLIDMYEKGISIAVSLEKELQSYEKKIHKIMANAPASTETTDDTDTITEPTNTQKKDEKTSKAVDIFSENDTQSCSS